MMGKDSIKKGLRLIFVDFLGLVVGILNGFFLPMVFSIEGYALFKAFSLYATYAFVFSFGISDGIYLIYGGKSEADTDVSRTKAFYFLLVKMQVIICAGMFFISYCILKDTALTYFVFFIIPLQLINFIRLYYRALGEFDSYSMLQSVLVIFELLNTLFAVFYIRSQDPGLFIAIKIINHLIVALLFSWLFLGKHRAVPAARLAWRDFIAVMKPGFAVLLADMAAALIFSMDRWFVMVSFNDAVFAYYSFAVSMFSLFIVFVTSITNIFYSNISRRIGDTDYINRLKNKVLIISSFFPAGYFILQGIIEIYLTEYTKALDILWILMLSLPLVSIINIIYSNLYKASGSVKAYLRKIVTVLAVSFSMIAAADAFWGTSIAIAWAAVLAFTVWYIYSSVDFQSTRINVREAVFLLLLIAGLSLVRELDMGMLASVSGAAAVSTAGVLMFYRRDAADIMRIIGSSIHGYSE